MAAKVRFSLLASPVNLISLGFGAGLSPVWPGTVGSIPGFLLFAALEFASGPTRIALYLALLGAGAYCCQRTGTTLGEQDHRAIVWDEVVGTSLTLEAVPHAAHWWIAAFFLFRIFDVWKPWPVRLAHNAKANGILVMLDDVLAAGYAAALLSVAHIVLFGLAASK